jgi:uncharacterized protein YdaU (DUF1376 family)
MLHTYYGTEKPLPFGKKLYRLLRANSRAEKTAVDLIVDKFWTRKGKGLVNGRAVEELEIVAKASEASRKNGNLGGRPKKTQQVSNQNLAGSEKKPSRQPRTNLSHPPSAIRHPPEEEQSPLPPLEKGDLRQRRSPHRANIDQARTVWSTLIASGGKNRDARTQAAIDAAGGWSRISMRTERDEQQVRSEFCEAYVAAVNAQNGDAR